MHRNSLSFLLLFFITVPSSHSSPFPHESHFARGKSHSNNSTDSPSESFEVTRPLPFDSLTPSCEIPIFSYDFGNTYGLPPVSVPYSPPWNCSWSHVVLRLSTASKGDQYDRIAAVWLAGAELLRTSTPEPTPEGVFWNVRKDVSRYSSLLSQSNISLSVMLENLVNDVFTGVYQVNLTFLYYDVADKGTAIKAVKNEIVESNPLVLFRNSDSIQNNLDLYEKPADLIIPISDIGDSGFWFRIENDSDVKYRGVQIPMNTYKAVIEIYVSSHGNDEFWYSNPPDSYIETNNLTTGRGNGAFREVLVKIDDYVVGSVIPFPVIFTGGINPLFWEPVAAIGAFDLPSYDIDLTPFLGLLLDGKEHSIGLQVVDSISYWLVDANLVLWLDKNVGGVQAEAVEYSAPRTRIRRKSIFRGLDGSFKVESNWKGEFLGWVNSSMGNLTTRISHKVKFENLIKFHENGTSKQVKQKVKAKTEVRVQSHTGVLIYQTNVKRRYPLEITTSTLVGSVEDTYLMFTKLEHSLKEQISNGNSSSSLGNSQRAEGWMFVRDHDVLSGAAKTQQNYAYSGVSGCYWRTVSAADGNLVNDMASPLCTSSS